MKSNCHQNFRKGGLLLIFLIVMVLGCITFFTSQTGLIIDLLGRQRNLLVNLRKADLPQRPPDQVSAREVSPGNSFDAH